MEHLEADRRGGRGDLRVPHSGRSAMQQSDCDRPDFGQTVPRELPELGSGPLSGCLRKERGDREPEADAGGDALAEATGETGVVAGAWPADIVQNDLLHPRHHTTI